MIMAGYLGAVSVVTTVKWFWFVIAMGLFVPVGARTMAYEIRQGLAPLKAFTLLSGKVCREELFVALFSEIICAPQVLYTLAVSFREAAVQRGGEIADVYGKVAWLTIITWIFYPYVPPHPRSLSVRCCIVVRHI